jgi:hypothetical protein
MNDDGKNYYGRPDYSVEMVYSAVKKKKPATNGAVLAKLIPAVSPESIDSLLQDFLREDNDD